MSSESVFITLDKIEAERRQFIEKTLSVTTPLAVVCYDKGIVIVTTRYKDATIRKIFQIHERIVLAGVGILSSIEEIADELRALASVQELNYSNKDVYGRFLVKELSKFLRKSFFNIRTKPVEADFLVCEVKRSGKKRIFNISFDGKVRESGKFFLIDHHEELTNTNPRGRGSVAKNLEIQWKENMLQGEAVNLALDVLEATKGKDQVWEMAVLEEDFLTELNFDINDDSI